MEQAEQHAAFTKTTDASFGNQTDVVYVDGNDTKFSTHWTEDVRTRDYYPTRYEFFLKDVLCGMLSRTAPRDEERCIARAMKYVDMVEKALDSKEA